jgi:hypothetical protein
VQRDEELLGAVPAVDVAVGSVDDKVGGDIVWQPVEPLLVPNLLDSTADELLVLV